MSARPSGRGSRQITQSIETINNLVNQLNSAQRTQPRGSERALNAATQIEEAARRQDTALRELISSTERMKNPSPERWRGSESATRASGRVCRDVPTPARGPASQPNECPIAA